MKYAKMLGLAALAAMALMAFGVGTASAKVCSGAGTGAACEGTHGKVYTGKIVASLTSGKNAVLTSGFVNVTCTESTAEGEVAGGASSPATGNITTLTFSSCTNNINGTACTASTTASGTNKWPATVTTTASTNGTMTVTNVTGSFTCNILGANRTCNYTASDAGSKGEISIAGGAPAEIGAAGVPLNKEAGSDALCSSTATWSGEYIVSTPTSIYLT